MRKHITYLLLFSCFLASFQGYAQDPHFTQIHRIPSWYNPAAAGHGVEHIRLTTLYRNQWSSVMSPFKTQALFFDKQVSKIGFGANIVNNSSGDAGIRQFFFNGQVSYRFAIGKSAIASGVQVGMIQKSFDPSKMSFDDQYTPDQGFDPSNPTTETFSYTKLTRPDLGAGLLWTYGVAGEERFYPYAGIGLQHINQPKESFIEDSNFIPRKITANAGVGIVLSDMITLTPMVLFAQQQFSKELMGGIVVKMPLEGRDNVEGGLMFRNKDAAAVYAGYQWNSFMLGMSYDVNISGVTGGPGAFELTLTYIPKAKEKKEAAKKKQKEKEKEKKQTPKAKSTATKASIPSAGEKLPVSVVQPIRSQPEKKAGPTVEPKEKKQPGTPGNTENKSSSTTKVIGKKPVVTNTPVVKKSNPVSTVPTTVSMQTRTANTSEVFVKAEKREIQKLIAPKVSLEPKKTNINKALKTKLPLETIEIPMMIKAARLELPKSVPLKLKSVPPMKVSMKSKTPLPAAERSEEVIQPAAQITNKVLVPVVMDKQGVKKMPAQHTAALPIDPKEEPVAMEKMVSKPLPAAIKISIPKPTVKSLPKSKVKGLPVEAKEELLKEKGVNTPVDIKVTATPAAKPTDADNDGVADDKDPCPYMKGTLASGGCPDTDGDGITDHLDQCPMEAGDANGNGCPSKPSIRENGAPVAQYFGNIEFKTASAEVHGIYKLDIIEPALDSIFQHDDLTLVITGHTDSEGDAPFNMILSQERADVVRAIFIRKGMPEARIQTVAYGETVPIKDNDSEEGKKRNRRVEVHVIKKKNP